MHSIFKWQKINFQTSQFNHFAFCCKSMTYGGHNVAKVFFFTCPTNPIWVWVQRIPSFFLYYCKQKYGHHLCKAWGFMLQNQENMPWCLQPYLHSNEVILLQNYLQVTRCLFCRENILIGVLKICILSGTGLTAYSGSLEMSLKYWSHKVLF